MGVNLSDHANDYEAFASGQSIREWARGAVAAARKAKQLRKLAAERQERVAELPVRTVEECEVYEESGKPRPSTNTLMKRLLLGDNQDA